jgi:predicted nucleic-acid-binding protein
MAVLRCGKRQNVRAVDTNVLVRYYLRDDPAQARLAEKALSAGDVFVPKTVLLELEWVLRSVAEQPAGKVLDCLTHLTALPGVTVEDHDQVEAALRHCRDGVDFADALHHAASHACTKLLTFDDRRYVRRAARLGLRPPVRLLTN